MCIFCPNIKLFVRFQNCFVQNFAHNRKLKLVQSSIELRNLKDEEEALEEISKEHEKNNHRGIIENFNELKQRVFYPNLLKIITKFINNCETCILAKHDRQPLKTVLEISEKPVEFNDIVHIDIWYPFRNEMYLTMIDKLSKHATIYKLESITWISILSVLKRRIMDFGAMRKIVFDNETCILHKTVIQFLVDNKIEYHSTTADQKTGNSDIERLHGTLNEHLRILRCDKTKEF